ncbi:hypothetical protein EV06_1938 [Prochlorococcus sp. MIT 0602]|nr:hypothetical protein EV06_1938 [Prochlorococcus sp. MIT 0602]
MSIKFIYLVNPENKKNQVKTIKLSEIVKEIAMTLKVFPTSSVSGFNLILSMYAMLPKT